MITAQDLLDQLSLKVIAGEKGLDNEVTGGYVCDLLSWVMSHAQKGDAWITVQTNINVAAVALLTEVACVIIPENISVDANTIQKSNEENIPILSGAISSYQLACKLEKVLRGDDDK